MKKKDQSHGAHGLKDEAYALPPLTEILNLGEVVRCNCGSAGFFDWGIRIHVRGSETKRVPESKTLASPAEVYICMECHRPVAEYGARYYDASEFITTAEVDALLESGAKIPARVKDP